MGTFWWELPVQRKIQPLSGERLSKRRGMLLSMRDMTERHPKLPQLLVQFSLGVLLAGFAAAACRAVTISPTFRGKRTLVCHTCSGG